MTLSPFPTSLSSPLWAYGSISRALTLLPVPGASFHW